jgi:DNA-binding MarR family transcriptional regulator
MTATHILSRWRRVRGSVKTLTKWMTLLNIAEAGAIGLSHSCLVQQTGLSPRALFQSVKTMREAGLVTNHAGPMSANGKHATIITITPKGLEFLGLSK